MQPQGLGLQDLHPHLGLQGLEQLGLGQQGFGQHLFGQEVLHPQSPHPPHPADKVAAPPRPSIAMVRPKAIGLNSDFSIVDTPN